MRSDDEQTWPALTNDPDAVAALVLGRVLEVEHLLRAVAVVSVEMGEGDDVDLLVFTQARPQFLLKVTPLVGGAVSAPHVGEVEESPPAVLEFDEAAIGVADVEEANDVHGSLSDSDKLPLALTRA